MLIFFVIKMLHKEPDCINVQMKSTPIQQLTALSDNGRGKGFPHLLNRYILKGLHQTKDSKSSKLHSILKTKPMVTWQPPCET